MRRVLIPMLLLTAAAIPAESSTRLTYQMLGTPVPVYWPAAAFPIKYAVDTRVSQVIPAATIDRAFSEWSSVPDATVSFQSLGVQDVKAGEDGKNSVSLTDDLFSDQHFLALTTNWYDTSGHLRESDIQIDATLVKTYNQQLLLEHEVGHLLGLDHSAVISSVMYPYVGKGVGASLDSDDRIAIAGVYARGDGGATIKGQVTDERGGIFAAQVVALNDSGEPVSTGLTNSNGEFVLERVPAGNYRVYAEPLDGPVDVQNLSGIWRTARTVSFPTQFAGGGTLHVEAGKIYGNVNVSSSSSPVTLNPKWIGAFPAGSSDVSLSASPVAIKRGARIGLAVGGDGFTSGMTTFEVLNPGFKRVGDYRYAGNYVSATFEVAGDAPPGSAVIMVKSGNDSASLTGALKIEGSQRGRAAGRS
ncbi:MAG: matrixin family metalloprotease [Acidobacteriota bacterium]